MNGRFVINEKSTIETLNGTSTEKQKKKRTK